MLLTAFTLAELHTEGPLLDVRVFLIRRFTGGALSISVAFFCLFGFIFLITQYFQFVKGYSTLSAGVHTLPFAIVAAVCTPLAAVVALRIGSRVVVSTGLLLMGGGLVVAAFNSQADTVYWGPIVVSMVLLALGLSSITAPTAEAVMGSVPDEQRGAAAGVNNTTRELGGTLGRGGVRLDLRLGLRAEDHQCLPAPADTGGAEGRVAPVGGGGARRHPPRAPRGAAGAGSDPVQRLPQRPRGRLPGRCRSGAVGCGRGLQAPTGA